CGALAPTVMCPARANVSVACPPPSVIAGATPPVTVTATAGETSPLELYLLTVAETGSPTLALAGTSTARGVGHAPVSGHGNSSTCPPGWGSSWQSPSPSWLSTHSSQNSPLPNV